MAACCQSSLHRLQCSLAVLYWVLSAGTAINDNPVAWLQVQRKDAEQAVVLHDRLESKRAAAAAETVSDCT